MIRKLNIHIIFISEAKVDSTYSDSQFAIPGYTLYRNDRKKVGGGILVYISTLLPCKGLRISRAYKTLEPLAGEIRIGTIDMIAIGVYRPPKSLSGNYLNYNWKRNLTAFAPGPLYGGTLSLSLVISILID